jgi:hypothetical protein
MADKQILEQMLEHLVNDEQQKAEELFHEYVIAKSREIYETLIEEEMDDEENDSDTEDKEVDEEFEDIAIEADDDMDAMGGDATDDLESDLEMDDDESEEDMDEKEPEELFQDLDAIVDELQAKFDAMGGDDEGDSDMDDEMKDDFELKTVREYVEKVPAGHGAEKKGTAEKADSSATGLKFNKNDMGGKPMKFGEEAKEASKGTAGGLANNKPQDMKTGNINVPGGNAGKTGFTHKEPGHGAEKKGAAEGSTDGQSLFRGRR